MKKSTRLLQLVLLFLIIFCSVVFVSSCGGDEGPGPNDIVVWEGMSDKEFTALRSVTEQFKTETGQSVYIIKVPFSELKIKYQIAAPAGQGPDLIIGPQDWIGFFATADLISPLNKSEFSDEQQGSYNPIALQNVSYDRKIYGVPMSMETIAIIYNKKLVPSEPQSMEELLQVASEFDNKDKKQYGFFFEVTNLYYAWPFLAGYGAEIFGETNGKLDQNKVLLNSPQTIEGIKFLLEMKTKYDLIPKGATNDMMNGIFFEKNMPFCLNGPWMLEDVKKQGIDFNVIPIPVLPNGMRPKPFVGVWAVMLNKQVRNRTKAVQLIHYLNKPENQKIICEAGGRIPSRYDALELIDDKDMTHKFAEAAKYGSPMPNHPAMHAVWEPMNNALTLIINEGKAPDQIMKMTVDRINEDIKIMME